MDGSIEERHKIILAGDFHCELTLSELNDWSVCSIASTEYRDLLKAQARRRSAEGQGPRCELENLVDDEMDALQAMGAFAEGWFDGVLAEREAKQAGVGCEPDVEIDP